LSFFCLPGNTTLLAEFLSCPGPRILPFLTQNIFKKSDIFSPRKNHHAKHHNSPPNHHNFTTNYHHQNTQIPQNPPKKYHLATLKLFPRPAPQNCEKLEAAHDEETH
jgi:hypothetical protein